MHPLKKSIYRPRLSTRVTGEVGRVEPSQLFVQPPQLSVRPPQFPENNLQFSSKSLWGASRRQNLYRATYLLYLIEKPCIFILSTPPNLYKWLDPPSNFFDPPQFQKKSTPPVNLAQNEHCLGPYFHRGNGPFISQLSISCNHLKVLPYLMCSRLKRMTDVWWWSGGRR